MELSGQFKVLVALPLGKEPLVPIGWETVWGPRASLDTMVKGKIPYPSGTQTCHPWLSYYTA